MSKRRRPQRGSFWRGPWPIVGTLLGIVALVAAFTIFSRLQSPPATSSGNDPAVVAAVAGVSPAVLETVGTGGAAVPLTKVSGTRLTSGDGKPEVLYIGAEWCPYCAAERWAMVVALSHFGTLKNLRFTMSSSSDVFPDTHTLSFYGSSFNSGYLEFVPIELQDRDRNPLQPMTAQQQQITQSSDANSSIPFIDIGNAYTMVGQGVAPGPLQGLSWQQIAGSLSNAGSPVTRAIVGNSNDLTAAICTLPGMSSAPICSDPAIKQIVSQLPH